MGFAALHTLTASKLSQEMHEMDFHIKSDGCDLRAIELEGLVPLGYKR